MKNQTIKIFDKEIDATMSFEDILKICKTIENTSVRHGEDGETVFFTFVRVDQNKEDDKEPYIAYEIIFNDGKLESIEFWNIQIIYSTVPKKEIKNIQS